MSVEYIKRLAGPYVGDGTGQKTFSFGFLIFDESDVYVAVAASSDSEPSDLQQGTDYTVSMNADQSATPGGTITLTSETGLAKDAVLVIGSAVDYTQTLDLTNYTRFAPERITTELDRIVVMIQQIVELLGRVVQVPPTSSISPSDLFFQLLTAAESAAQSAEDAAASLAACEQIRQLIEQYSWDIPHVVDSLRDVENYPYDGLFAVAGFGNAGGKGQNISNRYVKAEGSTELRALGERFADIVNVKDYGAVGDGVHDDTTAFEKAAEAANKGAVVFVPTGSYVLSKNVPGMFVSTGRVETTYPIDLIGLNAIKTRRFVERLDLSMLFTIVTPKATSGAQLYLQGYCSNGDDVVFIAFRTSDHSEQCIVRYVVSTGETKKAYFTNLYHVNSMTYCDGKIYVTPMSQSLPAVSKLDATTLALESSFTPEGLSGTDAYSIAYDGFKDEVFVAYSGKVYCYTPDWTLNRSFDISTPDWTPATGQSFGAYKGLLFVARSGSNPLQTRYESVLVWDSKTGKLVWQWFIGGSFGELEDVAFFKNKILLGFNDGSAGEIPFYGSDFDLSLPYESPRSVDENALISGPNFGKYTQEGVSLYCDADAGPAGDGTQEKPFNSLRRAVWSAKRYATPYRAAIFVKGDFSTRDSVLYLQGFNRMVQILPWGDNTSIVPPLFAIDSWVRIGAVTVKGLYNWDSGTTFALGEENSTLDIRGTKFDPGSSSETPVGYVYGLKGQLYITGADFSLCSSKLPTSNGAFVVGYAGCDIHLLSNLASFHFPVGSESTRRFFTVGLCSSQYADCRSSIYCNTYPAGKMASVFQGDGLGQDLAVNVPDTSSNLLSETEI